MQQLKMIQKGLGVLLGLAAVLTMTACQNERPRPGIPEARLVCEDEPARPVGLGEEYVDAAGVVRREVTDEEDGNYKTALRGAWHSCHSAVDWLRVFLQTP